MDPGSIEEKLRRAEARVSDYLARHGVELPDVALVIDCDLQEGTLATHRYPATVVLREEFVPESVIAHELIHIAQGTLEQFRGFCLLYVLVAEGLAEWVAKFLYLEHEVRHKAGYRLMELLVGTPPLHDEGCVRELLRLHDLVLFPADLEKILANPRMAEYSRDLLGRMADRIRESIKIAVQESVTDPTFISLGEEVRAWEFVLDGRFGAVAEEVDALLREWFATSV